MHRRPIKALVEPDPENPGQILLLSPTVGFFRPSLPRGAFVTPELVMGSFCILQRSYELVVPEGTRGAVLEQAVKDGVNKVQYRTPLLRVGARATEQMEAVSGMDQAGAASGEPLMGEIVIKSPTDGVFYRRSDPQSPPYVEVGSVVERGAQLGLVEVMKCFNQIRLDGESLPARCEVTAIQACDGGEVTLGQVLFVLRKMD